ACLLIARKLAVKRKIAAAEISFQPFRVIDLVRMAFFNGSLDGGDAFFVAGRRTGELPVAYYIFFGRCFALFASVRTFEQSEPEERKFPSFAGFHFCVKRRGCFVGNEAGSVITFFRCFIDPLHYGRNFFQVIGLQNLHGFRKRERFYVAPFVPELKKKTGILHQRLPLSCAASRLSPAHSNFSASQIRQSSKSIPGEIECRSPASRGGAQPSRPRRLCGL